MDKIAMVSEFHAKFGHPHGLVPQAPPWDRRDLRIKLIQEEFDELLEASTNGDVLAVADALADLLYVVYGTAIEWGIPMMDRVFEEVHRSNMSKVWPDGKVHYRADGKILKPPTFSPPDLSWVIAR
jgi:predicted HAD superfamily Cof-like phosphohydrolase